MKNNKYLNKIKLQIKKEELGKALKGLILYSTLMKNQAYLDKSIALSSRLQRLENLEHKKLIHPSSAAYLHNRIADATKKLFQLVQLETIGKKSNDRNDLVLNIKEKDLGKDMLLKLQTFFQKEFGSTFNLVLK